MGFMKKVTKQSRELRKVAGKKIDSVTDKSKKIIRNTKIKKNVAELSKNVGKFADKTFDLAKDKSNDLINEAKIQINVNENVTEVKEIYEEIGTSVYDAYKKGEKVNDAFLKECKMIEEITKEIIEMEVKELYLKNLRKCDNCNEIISIEDKFCVSCGTQQKPLKIEEAK